MIHRIVQWLRSREHGFTLAEILVTVAIISILAAASVPILNGHVAKTKKTVAVADGKALSNEILTLTTGITKFGTGGTIAISSPANKQATLTITNGTGYTPTSQPATFTSTVNVSNGTTAATGSMKANTLDWCLVVTSNDQIAAFDQTGYQVSKTTCTSGVLS